MKSSSKKGFTLIELLVVVAIIGILAAIILSALGDARKKARDARRESDIKTIQNALEMYYLEHGEYPSSSGTGGPYPNTHWSHSAYPSWSVFEARIGVDLPEDPINEVGQITGPYALAYNYFAHPHPDYCSLQMYTLVYNKETAIDTGPNQGSVTWCNGGTVTYNNSFVVGMSPRQ